MVRSWENRLKGASLKGVSDDESVASTAEATDHETAGPEMPPVVPTGSLESAVTETAALESTVATLAPPAPEPTATAVPANSNDSMTDRRATPVAPAPGLFDTDSIITDGLALAVAAVSMAVAVVERSTGLILWSSESWVERFGERDLLARHLPSTTEFGESPLPGPGESWRRTRTITFADGAEDLVDLLLVGASRAGDPDGEAIEFATVVALERNGRGPVVSDRAEVIAVVDGAIESARDGSTAVLYVDLDRFKVVHDLVGNIEALRLLELVNRRISATVRGSDLVFRLPSDEFIVVACELEDAEAAEVLAERIRLGVATLADVGNDMALTASVGVAIAEGDQSGDQLVAAAETAVYLAKGRGRNRIAVHDEELRTRTQRLLVVERQLRRAIDRRDVRFAYQPVVDLGSGHVVGAEALLRLGGDVGLSAVEVVAAAEHSGLMGVLGALVLEGVEQQLGSMLRSVEREHTVMINLSAPQLADESLLAALGELTADSSIRPGRLALEVPELVLREHRDAFAKMAAAVQPRFKLGVDGFGISPESFDALAGLPIDYLKLHRSVTTTIGQDDGERARLAQTVERAFANDIVVVALGVERADQAAALRSVGVRRAQGFLYAGAVTSEDLLDLIETGFPDPAQQSPTQFS